jgi:cytochrome c2
MITPILASLALLAVQEDGRKAFTRCGNCHAVPDSKIDADKKWIRLIEKTA